MGPKFEVASVEIKCLERTHTHAHTYEPKMNPKKKNTVRGFGAEIHL